MDFNFKVFAVYPGNCCACRLVLGEAEPLSGTSNCAQWALHQGGPCCEQCARVLSHLRVGAFCTHSNLHETQVQDHRAGF